MLLISGYGSLAWGDVKITLGDSTVPFPVRQDKAYRLLRTWEFVAPETSLLFSINDEERLAKLETVLATLDKRVGDGNTECELTSATEKYLVSTVLHWQNVDDLSFSDEKLRHFFRINPTKYSNEPRAGVAEFVVPREYVESSREGSAVLDQIRKRLETEDFARVSYDVTSKFESPNTGFRGTVLKREARDGVWEYYRAAWNGPGQGVGGPYEIDDGYLFVRVHSFLEDQEDSFQYYRNRVAQDYGRVWLKKIHADTMTTITDELHPKVSEFTTIPLQSDVAFSVAGHSTTFKEARQMLAFLKGDERSLPFWRSIQKQALELELVYHSSIGAEIRRSDLFKKLSRMLCTLQAARDNWQRVHSSGVSHKDLKDWFDSNRSRFTSPGKISYTLVRCESTTNSATCSAFLERLGRDITLDFISSAALSVKTIEGVIWSEQPVPVQVATQDISAGEWSQVFSLDGVPAIVHLREKEVKTLDFSDNQDIIRAEYEIATQQQFWQNLLGLN